jgi:hypothetical protein
MRTVCRLLRTALAALLLGAAAVRAAELAGFAVPDRLEVDDRELVLNGLGLRTATAFKVKIYVAALYLEQPSRDAAQVLATSGPKQIRMQYLYAIDADDMKRAWEHSFTQSCPDRSCAAFRTQIAEFQAGVGAVAKGDVYDYVFRADRVEILRSGAASATTIRGADFARLLLSTWIGVAPPTEELKSALLGAGR